MLFAVKSPLLSRLTIVFETFKLVAAIVSLTLCETCAAVFPPTKLTTVVETVPVTSPANAVA